MMTFFRLTKVDEAKREVWGRATEEVVDRSGEVFDYDSSKPLFQKWSEGFSEATDGKSLGNIRSMHGKVAAGKVIAIDFQDAEKAIDIGTKIVDDNEWEKVLEGVHTGFSIGGKYIKKWKDAVLDAMRYTADPNEISLVDSPCLQTAKFFDVVKADGSVIQKAFVEKGMDHVAQLAWTLKSISWLTADQLAEAAREGDTSPIPAKLKAWLAAGAAILTEMTAEETAELVSALPEALDDPLVMADTAGDLGKSNPEGINQYSGGGGASTPETESADRAAAAATAHAEKNPSDKSHGEAGQAHKDAANAHRDAAAAAAYSPNGQAAEMSHYSQAQAHDAAGRAHAAAGGDRHWASQKSATVDDLAKKGARHSAADKDHLQAIHDHAASLGADCGAAKMAKVQIEVADLPKVKEALTKAQGLADDLAKATDTITQLTTQTVTLTKRVQELESLPESPRGATADLPGIVLDKGQDNQGNATSEAAVQKIQTMPEGEEKALAQIRLIHAGVQVKA